MAKTHIGCSCQNPNIGKMKRRRINGPGKGLQNTVTNKVLPVTGGILIGLFMDKFADKIPVPVRYAKAGAGVACLLLQGKNPMVGYAGVGLLASAVTEVAADSIKGVNGINLLPAGKPSYYIAGTDEPSPQFVPNGTRVVVD